MSRRSTPSRGTAGSLVSHVAAIVNENRPLSVLSALEILALETQLATEAAGWAVSVTDVAGTSIITCRSADSIRDLAFVAAVDLPGSDPAETAQLAALGYRAVLAAGATDSARGYLVEVFATADYTAMLDVVSSVQILVHFCVSAANTSTQAT